MTVAETTMGPRVSLLRDMLTIRAVEERCEKLFSEAKVRGSMHLAIGQEAVAVGACAALRPADALSFTYRSHAWALARGIPPAQVFAECFGRSGGCSGGRGGSKHMGDWAGRRMLPSNAIVAAGLPLANGIALHSKYTNASSIALAVMGDGALNEGGFYEALSQAVVYSLPVVYLCENNEYSELTPGPDMSPVGADLTRIASGLGAPTATVDGMDVDAVTVAVSDAADRARAGGGPTFVEAKTYRFCGHMTGDQQRYRTKEEIELRRIDDPLIAFTTRLRGDGHLDDDLDALRSEVAEAVLDAEAEAWASPEPSADDILVGAPSWTRLER